MERANCHGKGTTAFFPERGQSLKPGKDICAPCPVKTECREYQLKTKSSEGMWAGKMVPRRQSSW